VVEDGPLVLVGEFFDAICLRHFLAAMESALVIPYRCVLQNLLEAKDDLLTIELNQMNTIMLDTITHCQTKLDEMEAARI
jgi:hypothetical protein